MSGIRRIKIEKYASKEIKEFVSKSLIDEKVILNKDSDYPKISIVTPSYNQVKFLDRTILSILNQNYPNLECIIINGGSVVRNTGIKVAKGEYIAFQDSNDEWSQEKLEKQILKFKSSDNKTTLLYTEEVIKDEVTGEVLKYKTPSLSGMVFEKPLKGDFIGTCSSEMVRASALCQAGGFDDKLPVRQDWDLWLRIARDYKINYVKLC